MRERLAELLEQKDNLWFKTYLEEADYLLENGVIVPPCKIGDEVWYELYGEIISAVVYFCRGDLSRRGFEITDANARDKHGTDLCFDEKCLGKAVFLTREEAEQALKEREKA